MQRHGQTLATLALVPLSESTPTPMLLSGFAARLDVDIERVAFTHRPVLPANVARHSGFMTVEQPTNLVVRSAVDHGVQASPLLGARVL
jgi:hypothetical protein